MTDHSIYLESNLEDFAKAPGFPYLRMNPALANPEAADRFSAPEEHLLLAIHCESSRLLVVSNKHIRIYQIPAKKSGLQKAGSFGLNVGVGMIPVVGEVLDAGEKVKGLSEWVWNGVSGKKRKERAEDKLRAAEGMPTKKELEDLVWDLRSPTTLAMILVYKDKILLRNGFEWKEHFKASLEDSSKEPVEITIDTKGVRISAGRQKTRAEYVGKDWGHQEISSALLKINLPALQAAGWTVEASEKLIVLKKSRS